MVNILHFQELAVQELRVQDRTVQEPSGSPYLDMHNLVFGINFQIHSVSLTILVSIHLLIHLSTHPCHYLHSQHPSLLHSFTPDLKLASSTNPFHLNFTYLLCLHDNRTGPDLSC